MTEEQGNVQLNLITNQLEALITGDEIMEFRVKEAARAIGIKTNFQGIFDWLSPFSLIPRYPKLEVIRAIRWAYCQRKKLEVIVDPRAVSPVFTYTIKTLQANPDCASWESFFDARGVLFIRAFNQQAKPHVLAVDVPNQLSKPLGTLTAHQAWSRPLNVAIVR
jgi:hypothetical protein